MCVAACMFVCVCVWICMYVCVCVEGKGACAVCGVCVEGVAGADLSQDEAVRRRKASDG